MHTELGRIRLPLIAPTEVTFGLQRYKCTFSYEKEQALYDWVIDLHTKLMGVISKELRKLAFDFAEDLEIPHNFNRQITGMAGKTWLRNFTKRHNLSNRKTGPTSSNRFNDFNKEEVDKFFDLLEEINYKNQYPKSRIWGVDETGVTVNPKTSSRIIAKKGIKQVGGKTSQDRGQTVTAEICYSATGVFMPPMLIFPRVNRNKSFLYGKSHGSWAEFKKSGWMETDIFIKWFREFIKFSNSTKEHPVLLLLDGHVSHIKNLEVAKLGVEYGVTILCLHPDCTHRMQPADIGFMKPLSAFYTEEINAFQRKGAVVQMKNIFEIFGKAWQKAYRIETAVSSFRKTGICPVDRTTFKNLFKISASPIATDSVGSAASTIATNPVEGLNLHNTTDTTPLNELSNSIEKYKDIICKKLFANDVSSSSPEHSFTSEKSPQSLKEPSISIPLSTIMPLYSLLKSLIPPNGHGNAENSITRKKRSKGTSICVTSEVHTKNLEEAERLKNLKSEKIKEKARIKEDHREMRYAP
ncbi:hypothetical protein TKK_0018236 [Trichogramma kaykai]